MDMENEKIDIAEIAALGIHHEKLQTDFYRVANGLLRHQVMDKSSLMAHLEMVLKHPELYAEKRENKFKNLAKRVMELRKQGVLTSEGGNYYALREEKIPFAVFGAEQIEAGAYAQMETAARLPIALAGALMPDAHQGYGLPIGGVLATDPGTVIPYAVGVDIACRMCMSIFDLPSSVVDGEKAKLEKLLMDHTHFGMGATTKVHLDTSLFDRKEWTEVKTVKALKDKAYAQLGTSGTGNHFVEWGELTVEENAFPGLPAGRYLALLSHSGSRGFGGNIAHIYSTIAMKKSVLPKEARHLSWLDLDSEEGQEYWIAMNLAGDYASANHHEIHHKIARALGQKPLQRIENHHNFAWKEQLPDGREAIVHRKGATPAGAGVIGIIPGSMSTPGFVVRGKGNRESLHSAAHGAGRVMSRSAAFKNLEKRQVDEELSRKGVTVIGSGLDEAPMVYKDIHAVMDAQSDLVEILARFQPRIVRMADPREKPED